MYCMNKYGRNIIIQQMMEYREKKIIPYQLYITKKYKNGDHLTDIINRKRKQKSLELEQCGLDVQQLVRKQMNEKRLDQLRKQYPGGNNKLSNPQPFIKRTWVSPLVAQKTGQKSNYNSLMKNMHLFVKNKDKQFMQKHQKQQMNKVCKQLYMNKKLHLFGEFMYCEFDEKYHKKSNKQNHEINNPKNREKVLEMMHKQYEKLQKTDKKLVICSSTYKKPKFHNPLQSDKYFNQIMKKNDSQLTEILINILAPSGTFTFSSFINFYDIFVWQQANKISQIEFVLKLLMKTDQQITYNKLNTMIDFLCSRINLPGASESLQGFNEVMKKLILGEYYTKQINSTSIISRESLKQNLQQNQQCISIMINIFYSQ